MTALLPPEGRGGPSMSSDRTPVDVIIVDPTCREPIGHRYLTVAIKVMSRALAAPSHPRCAIGATSVGLCLTHVAAGKSAWLAARGITKVEWPMAGSR